ncbi:hypothetical protein CS0771_49740 [Catellatospora sp. IY07-71]|uniref:hypothetical protein n=1 Tax=Catellatospora sp. IY07-71 TaxID=2728827 RepID=UPI001BB3EBA1|nr:hypothetical protein [Catellatospora sp. IY07-71]BCJ75430.1 hypothetical protein CS0771_49740 [Catellatospora sp. IY07-71]
MRCLTQEHHAPYHGITLPGGDGVHNDIATRAALRNYDRPLFNLFERVYGGRLLGS